MLLLIYQRPFARHGAWGKGVSAAQICARLYKTMVISNGAWPSLIDMRTAAACAWVMLQGIDVKRIFLFLLTGQAIEVDGLVVLLNISVQ